MIRARVACKRLLNIVKHGSYINSSLLGIVTTRGEKDNFMTKDSTTLVILSLRKVS